jgi:hypothetical protein
MQSTDDVDYFPDCKPHMWHNLLIPKYKCPSKQSIARKPATPITPQPVSQMSESSDDEPMCSTGAGTYSSDLTPKWNNLLLAKSKWNNLLLAKSKRLPRRSVAQNLAPPITPQLAEQKVKVEYITPPATIPLPRSTRSGDPVRRKGRLISYTRRAVERRRRQQLVEAGGPPCTKIGRPRKENGTQLAKQRAKVNRAVYHNKKACDSVEKMYANSDPRAGIVQMQTLDTMAGKRRFPEIAKINADAKSGAQAMENLSTIVNNSSKKNRAGLMCYGAHMMETTKFARMSNRPAQTIRNIRSRFSRGSKIAFMEEPTVMDKGMKIRVDKKEVKIVVKFFKNNTVCYSGTRGNPDKLLMTRQEMYMRFAAAYPELLREMIVDDPDGSIFEEANDDPSNRFRKSIVAAVYQATSEQHDVNQEYQARKKIEEYKYRADLEHNKTKKNRRTSNLPKPLIQTKVDPTEIFDRLTYVPKAVAYQTFWDIIKFKKVKFTQRFHPHYCPIHRQGPVDEELLKLVTEESAFNQTERRKLQRQEVDMERRKIEIQTQIKEKGDTLERLDFVQIVEAIQKNKRQILTIAQREAECSGKISEHQLKIKEYKEHLQQYQHARPYVKDIEDNLLPGEVVVFRDFVNTSSQSGKVSNLVLVLLWRTTKGGALQVRKIHNFCTDKQHRSCDAAYVFDVFRFLLTKTNEFKGFHKIYLSGDHGPHFTCVKTFWHESQFCELYGKELHVIYLCSYHAFNRCDRAGLEAVVLDHILQMSNRGPITEVEYSHLIHSRGDPESIAYPYVVIDRSERNWPSKKEFRKRLNLKKICEVRFLDVTGVILYRTVPGVGTWITLDLMRRNKTEKVCEGCTSASLPRCWQSVIKIKQTIPFSCPVIACSQECDSVATIDAHMKNQHNMLEDNPLLFCNPPRVVQHGLDGCCPILQCMSYADHDSQYTVPLNSRVDPNALQLTKKNQARLDAKKKIPTVTCPFTACMSKFMTRPKANYHMKIIHKLAYDDSLLYPRPPSDYPYRCWHPDCSKEYKTTKGADRHMQNKHDFKQDNVLLYCNTSAGDRADNFPVSSSASPSSSSSSCSKGNPSGDSPSFFMCRFETCAKMFDSFVTFEHHMKVVHRWTDSHDDKFGLFHKVASFPSSSQAERSWSKEDCDKSRKNDPASSGDDTELLIAPKKKKEIVPTSSSEESDSSSSSSSSSSSKESDSDSENEENLSTTATRAREREREK